VVVVTFGFTGGGPVNAQGGASIAVR